MARRSPLRTGIHVVKTADSGDLARGGRVAAMRRRRQLSQGKQALIEGGGGTAAAAAPSAGAPTLTVHRGGGS